MSQLELFVSNMTVAQLAHVAGLSLEQIAALVLGSSPRAAEPTVTRTSARAGLARVIPRQEPAILDRNTRTKEGRVALEQAIVDFLGSREDPARALEIRRAVGGTADQVRTRLNALIDAGRVTFQGRASATRYAAVR